VQYKEQRQRTRQGRQEKQGRQGQVKLVRLHTPEDVRRASVALGAWATRDGLGVNGGDERHEIVTEGRRTQWERAHARGDAWAQRGTYSSCLDLLHWVMRCLGCRDETLVNRNDDFGTRAWIPGANVTMLSGAKHLHRQLWSWPPAPGDFVYRDNPWGGHGCLVREWDEQSGVATTEDYGQPYGARRTPRIGPGTRLGGNRILWVVDVTRVPIADAAVVPDAFDGGEPDDNPYWPSLPSG
jgi:hypothetical protein